MYENSEFKVRKNNTVAESKICKPLTKTYLTKTYANALLYNTMNRYFLDKMIMMIKLLNGSH